MTQGPPGCQWGQAWEDPGRRPARNLKPQHKSRVARVGHDWATQPPPLAHHVRRAPGAACRERWSPGHWVVPTSPHEIHWSQAWENGNRKSFFSSLNNWIVFSVRVSRLHIADPNSPLTPPRGSVQPSLRVPLRTATRLCASRPSSIFLLTSSSSWLSEPLILSSCTCFYPAPQILLGRKTAMTNQTAEAASPGQV